MNSYNCPECGHEININAIFASKGGSTKSAAKAASAAENGKRGGRPIVDRWSVSHRDQSSEDFRISRFSTFGKACKFARSVVSSGFRNSAEAFIREIGKHPDYPERVYRNAHGKAQIVKP